MSELRKVMHRILIGAGSAGAAVLMLGATDAYAAGAELEEIIVTAQKRNEALLDVPLSITAVDGAALERQHAPNLQDYLKLVPGLQLDQSTPGNGRLVMRGVNTGGVASTVAVYVDETPFGSSTGLVNGGVIAGDFDTFDLQRIEVLRGPQGTLYGASSLAGVLKYVPNLPDTERFESRVRAGVESVEHGEVGYSGVGMVNIPISDTFALRGVGYYRELGGFVDSVGTAGSDVEDDINGSKSTGGRLSALWTPNEDFSLRLSAVLQDISAEASSAVESDPDTLDILHSNLTQSQYTPEFRDTNYRVYNATLDWDVGFATLTSATSYNEFDSPFRGDVTMFPADAEGTPLNEVIEPFFGPNEDVQEQTTKYDKITQEFRLASAPGERFDWMVGAYYTKEEGDILQHFAAVTPGTLDEIPVPEPLVPIVGDTLGDLTLNSTYEEIAGFVNGTIHFGEKFDLALGGRYSENDQEAKQDAFGVLAGGAEGIPYAPTKSSEDVFTWSVAPKYELNDHASLYARAATGFRPGGPNVLPVGAPSGVPLVYDSDSLTSYEVGFKVESPDRAYSLDIAAFHIDWEDIQLAALVNNFGVNVNGGDATSDGLEFTATAHLESGFNVSLNGAYTDAQLEDDTPPDSGGLKGDALPFTPEWSLSLNGDYEWTVGAGTTAYVGGAVRWLSDQTGTYDLAYRLDHGRQREVPSYEVVDLQGGLDFGSFTVELYAKNVTDSDGRTSMGGLSPNGSIPTGVIRPRTYGLALGFEF